VAVTVASLARAVALDSWGNALAVGFLANTGTFDDFVVKLRADDGTVLQKGSWHLR
jgi:hypothetical protein